MASQPLPVTTPRPVLAYGVLGVLPFVALPLAALLAPGWAAVAGAVAAGYGALILSFLGGARWGLEVGRPQVRFVVVSLAMLPTLVGLALLLLPAELRVVQLAGLAAALVVHWLWDRGSAGLPAWYPGLRTLLTGGAVAGLLAMAAVV